MTFLNPAVLFGLLAATIPVILHLLNLRKLRTIEFSTLSFLKELQQTKIRKLKLRQMLLLIIRTLMIALIVFAFARPALRGTILGSIGTNAHSTVVFILDDSFSMSANDERGELFNQAKESTKGIIDLLKDGDEAFLIKLSDVPQATIDPATHDFGMLRTVVNESQISNIRKPLEDALRLSAKLMSKSNNANKEVYIVSDFQKTLFPQSAKQRNEHTVQLCNEQVKFFTLDLSKKEIPNSAIDSVEVVTKILEKDKPALIYTSFRNFSQTPLQDNVVSIFLNGVHTAQSNVDIEPWGSASLELTVTPKNAGFVKGYVELERDAIEQDNRRYFTMYVPDRINISFVSPSQTDIRFPLIALTARSTESQRSLINIQQITPAKLLQLDFNKLDVLVLSNVTSFNQTEADRIKDFVRQGGGVIIFPGSDIDISNYNTFLLPALTIPQIEGSLGSISQQANLSFQKIDYDHPLFSTIFEKNRSRNQEANQDVESPNIGITLEHQTGQQGHSIISMTGGTTFLSEYTLGSGKILFYSVAPILSWSDFPLKGIFAPLIYRSVLYLSAQNKSQTEYMTGDNPIIKLQQFISKSDSSNGKQYSMISPDGTEELIQPIVQPSAQVGFGTSVSFGIKNLFTPGFYEIKTGTKLLSAFAVNIDRLESDIRSIPNNELNEFWHRLGIPTSSIHTLESGENLKKTVLESRFGIELWKYCIGLALFLALLEMLIARDSRKAAQQQSI
jgi:hypothetical protein